MKLVWDKVGEHFYETGVDHGVLYPIQADKTYSKGVAWNGLTNVSQSPSGAEETKLFADNIKYLSLRSAEDYGATIEAYTYPDEWAECDGSAEIAKGVNASQQGRKTFGFSYRTLLGNDTDGTDYGYKIHIVYGCTASPSERAYATVNDSPEAIQFSWEISSIPVEVPGFKPSAHLEIDSTKCSAEALKAIEDVLYGTEEVEASLPMPKKIMELVEENTNTETNTETSTEEPTNP